MAVRAFNFVSISAIVGICLLFGTLWHLQSRDLFYGSIEEHSSPPSTSTTTQVEQGHFDGKPALETRPSFLEIAQKHGTDKVSPHHYNFMYEKYLQPMRDAPLKMLEIGLGCNMAYGPGKSYYTWLEFLPNVDLHYIEYDAACVQKWSKNITGVKIFTGDQADTKFLNKFITETGGGFDIIIDDGGHTMTQQIVSLNTLYPIVKPGGIYFCEDLATSYLEEFGAGAGKKTMMGMISEILTDLNVGVWGGPTERKNGVAETMRSVECGEEICAFFKKDLGKTEVRT